MRMYDIIHKKREGGKLTKEEIQFFIDGYTEETIPDYQAAALLMAIYFRGMDMEETTNLTMAMAASGDMVDLSPIEGIKVDKHSTGGVGDKTTLIITPIVASCGVPVAKMSGRGLGHTGGTLDKLESIPNLTTSLSEEAFFQSVRENGIAVIGQTGNLAPADKKLYALRDVTATVDNISLISASIMSKKLAAGSDAILLDVKTGSGAFMKTIDDSIRLAQAMVDIGVRAGRNMAALITDMDRPLGNNIGNSLEVIEAAEVLSGKGAEDLTFVCKNLAANMLHLGGKGEIEDCFRLVDEAISSGRALEKLKTLVRAQGGDESVIDCPEKFEKAKISYDILSGSQGYITHMETEKIGLASVVLGAGRESKADRIDYSAGIILKKKVGDRVEKGDVLATLFTNKEESVAQAEKMYIDALTFGQEKPKDGKHIFARITKDGVERL